MKKETRQRIVYWLSLISAVVSAVLLLVFLVAQAYIRWAINQNFLLLGGSEMEVLTVLALGQVVALAYLHRGE